MKLTYTSPLSATVRLHTEGMMANSFLFHNDGTSGDGAGTADTEDNRGGQWSSGKNSGIGGGLWDGMDD